MTAERNKTLVRRVFEEALNESRFELLDELVADDYVNHDMPAPAPGREGLKQVWGMFRAAFPDGRVTLHEVFADGDLVGTRGAFAGTHGGDFMGIPATGRPVVMKYIDLWRVENGRLRENWVQLDLLGVMQQLGAIPAPTAA